MQIQQKGSISPAGRVGCAVLSGALLVMGIRRVQRPGVLTSLLLGTGVYLAWISHRRDNADSQELQ
jgi:hypothetical protein